MPSNYTQDAQTSLNGTTAITATGNGSVASFDLGSGQVAPGTMVDFTVTALDTANADETYMADVELSTDSGFTTPMTAGRVEITSTGKWFAAFTNVQGGTYYRYVRLRFTLAGTTPSITAPAKISGWTA